MAHQKGDAGRSFKNIPTLPPPNSRCCVATVDNQALNPLRDPLQTVAQSRCNAEVGSPGSILCPPLVSAFSFPPSLPMHLRGHFQAQGVQADETGRVVLV